MGEEEDGSDALGSGEQERAEAGAKEAPPPNSAEDSMEVDLTEKDDGAAKDLAAPAGEPGGPLTAFIFAATELRMWAVKHVGREQRRRLRKSGRANDERK